jgi:hypothetical protein
LSSLAFIFQLTSFIFCNQSITVTQSEAKSHLLGILYSFCPITVFVLI